MLTAFRGNQGPASVITGNDLFVIIFKIVFEAVRFIHMKLLVEQRLSQEIAFDNTKSWTGLSVEESIRMTQDRDKRRKYVHGVANHRIEEG